MKRIWDVRYTVIVLVIVYLLNPTIHERKNTNTINPYPVVKLETSLQQLYSLWVRQAKHNDQNKRDVMPRLHRQGDMIQRCTIKVSLCKGCPRTSSNGECDENIHSLCWGKEGSSACVMVLSNNLVSFS